MPADAQPGHRFIPDQMFLHLFGGQTRDRVMMFGDWTYEGVRKLGGSDCAYIRYTGNMYVRDSAGAFLLRQ